MVSSAWPHRWHFGKAVQHYVRTERLHGDSRQAQLPRPGAPRVRGRPKCPSQLLEGIYVVGEFTHGSWRRTVTNEIERHGLHGAPVRRFDLLRQPEALTVQLHVVHHHRDRSNPPASCRWTLSLRLGWRGLEHREETWATGLLLNKIATVKLQIE